MTVGLVPGGRVLVFGRRLFGHGMNLIMPSKVSLGGRGPDRSKNTVISPGLWACLHLAETRNIRRARPGTSGLRLPQTEGPGVYPDSTGQGRGLYKVSLTMSSPYEQYPLLLGVRGENVEWILHELQRPNEIGPNLHFFLGYHSPASFHKDDNRFRPARVRR
jgi:hypothetical protein